MHQTDVNQIEAAYHKYELDGFAILRNVIDRDLIEEARSHVEWLARRYPELRPEHYHHPLMRDDAFWIRLITDARLLDIAERFLGPDIACFTSHYICKPAIDGQAVLWHQDGAYWDLRPMRAITLWLAIDRTGPENGCLRMLPGTHLDPLRSLKIRAEVPNMLASAVDADYVKSVDAVDIPLNPGDVSIHHPHIVHGSEPNRSPYRRCGLDIGYMPADVSIHNEALYQNPVLVRGRAPVGRAYQPWPKFRPGETVDFKGRENWDMKASEHNKSFTHLTQSDEAPITTVQHMIRRLASGSVKSRVEV